LPARSTDASGRYLSIAAARTQARTAASVSCQCSDPMDEGRRRLVSSLMHKSVQHQ